MPATRKALINVCWQMCVWTGCVLPGRKATIQKGFSICLSPDVHVRPLIFWKMVILALGEEIQVIELVRS